MLASDSRVPDFVTSFAILMRCVVMDWDDR
jgi:hypothetical protein